MVFAALGVGLLEMSRWRKPDKQQTDPERSERFHDRNPWVASHHAHGL